MKKFVTALVLALSLVVAPSAQPDPFTAQAKDATAILYVQDAQGTLGMLCTATAFNKVKGGYQFLSAAHCAGNDDTAKEQVAKAPTMYVTFDQTKTKTFYQVTAAIVGYQHRGDDFMVVEVPSDQNWPIVPIGDEAKEAEGNAILNVAAPLGLGKQVFRGTISKINLDRPVEAGDINWRGVMLLQLPGTGGGSSGSSIISPTQKAIVGILVGSIGGNITAVPISRFKEFWRMSAEGKYRWARPTDQ